LNNRLLNLVVLGISPNFAVTVLNLIAEMAIVMRTDKKLNLTVRLWELMCQMLNMTTKIRLIKIDKADASIDNDPDSEAEDSVISLASEEEI